MQNGTLSHRLLDECCKFFNVGYGFSLYELEYRKNELLEKYPEETDTINNNYQLLIGVKVPKNRGNYKQISKIDLEYVEKKLPNSANSSNYVNGFANEIRKFIDETIQKINSTEDEEQIKLINLDFATKYQEYSKKIVEIYYSELDEKNGHKGTYMIEDSINLLTDRDFLSNDIKKLITKTNNNIQKVNDDRKSKLKEIRERHSLVLQKRVLLLIDEAKKFYEDERFNDMFVPYYGIIDSFYEEKYNNYIEEINNLKIYDYEELVQVKREITDRFIAEMKALNNKLATKIVHKLRRKIFESQKLDEETKFYINSKLSEVEDFGGLVELQSYVDKDDYLQKR